MEKGGFTTVSWLSPGDEKEISCGESLLGERPEFDEGFRRFFLPPLSIAFFA